MNAIVKEVHGEVMDGVEFFAPVSSDVVDHLIGRYQSMRANILAVADFVNGGSNAAAISYFLNGNRQDRDRYVRDVKDIFNIEGAIAQLNSDYWQQAIRLTDVYDYMPAKRRNEWDDQIREKKTPDFEESTVRSTLMDLLANREMFFCERVDGIFRALSGEHVTNRPEGFGKRMIIARVYNDYGMVEHRVGQYIHDMRVVIAKFMGRDEPSWGMTDEVLAGSRRATGEWFSVDGGAIRIRSYMKGTLHLEVHPDMAWRLNCILAKLYPMAIPSQFRQKPKRKLKDFVMMDNLLPVSVIKDLLSMKAERHTSIKTSRWGDPKEPLITNPYNRRFPFGEYDKAVRAQAVNVLKSIGAVRVMCGPHKNIEIWEFDYDPTSVIGAIIASGSVPEQKSHQYYPTPENLAQLAVEMADIQPGHYVMEPSAGQGGISDFIPEHAILNCYEISKLHCGILEAKGYGRAGHRTIHQADFLKLASEYRGGGYNRIVMNPPYSEGRWKAHTEAAAGMLRDKGRLVAILPASAKGKFTLPGMKCEWSDVFSNEFDGTSISVVILKADRI